MSIDNDITNDVAEVIHRTNWKVRAGRDVPDLENVKLESNEAIELDDAVVLYADLAKSSDLVKQYSWNIVSEIYKTFLSSAAKIIRGRGGVVTAFDGDRIMGVFTGDYKNTSSARAALGISWAVTQVIQPGIRKQYPNTAGTLSIGHACGIDSSALKVVRAGARGATDLVWIGTAANSAAKLSEMRSGSNTTWITPVIYNRMADEAKFFQGQQMWEAKSFGAAILYSSGWWVNPAYSNS